MMPEALGEMVIVAAACPTKFGLFTVATTVYVPGAEGGVVLPL